MANVYTAGSDRRLIIYSISRYIFLRTAYIDGIERPIMLVSDFLDGLSDVVLGDTIYYAYQNQNGDILVKNVMNNEALFRVKSSENPDMHCPQLVVNKDRLMLFYMVTNPLTDRLSLRAVYPLEEGDSLNIPVDCENVDMYEVFGMQGKAFLYVDSFYEITSDGKFIKCQDTDMLMQSEQKISEYENQLNTYMQENRQAIQTIIQAEKRHSITGMLTSPVATKLFTIEIFIERPTSSTISTIKIFLQRSSINCSDVNMPKIILLLNIIITVSETETAIDINTEFHTLFLILS